MYCDLLTKVDFLISNTDQNLQLYSSKNDFVFSKDLTENLKKYHGTGQFRSQISFFMAILFRVRLGFQVDVYNPYKVFVPEKYYETTFHEAQSNPNKIHAKSV